MEAVMENTENIRNSCFTYFCIKGDFNPDNITKKHDLIPSKYWSVGDLRRNDTRYDFALWGYDKCNEYDVFVENQIMKTIISKTNFKNSLRIHPLNAIINFDLDII